MNFSEPQALCNTQPKLKTCSFVCKLSTSPQRVNTSEHSGFRLCVLFLLFVHIIDSDTLLLECEPLQSWMSAQCISRALMLPSILRNTKNIKRHRLGVREDKNNKKKNLKKRRYIQGLQSEYDAVWQLVLGKVTPQGKFNVPSGTSEEDRDTNRETEGDRGRDRETEQTDSYNSF